MKTTFSYDGCETVCTIQIKDRKYVGKTYCHVDDLDMESQKIGEEIASQRAVVKLLKDSKKYYKAQAKTLKDFYASLGKVKESYVTYKLKKELAILDATIDEITDAINSIEIQIKNYIDGKQDFQKKIRDLRKRNETAN